MKNHPDNNRVKTGVSCPVPIQLHTPYVQSYGYSEGAYPISEQLSAEVLGLLMYPTLTEEEVVGICAIIKNSLTSPD